MFQWTRGLSLDKPASNLTPQQIDRMRALDLHLSEMGIAILLIEHVRELLTDVRDRLLVLDRG